VSGARSWRDFVRRSTTSTIIVFAQELVPHRFGMIAGVFFGVAFAVRCSPCATRQHIVSD